MTVRVRTHHNTVIQVVVFQAQLCCKAYIHNCEFGAHVQYVWLRAPDIISNMILKLTFIIVSFHIFSFLAVYPDVFFFFLILLLSSSSFPVCVVIELTKYDKYQTLLTTLSSVCSQKLIN